MSKNPSVSGSDFDSVGAVVEKISVQLGTSFLEHFSEQLYSSPNKAFEELIANAWDADARTVYIEIPDDLSDPKASLFILDDGTSMDATGLHDLWKVAYSNKREQAKAGGRAIIGKFGIGKLATYVLAGKLTYICRASDGKLRAVTMDYGKHIQPSDKTKFIKDLTLDLREAKWEGVAELLNLSEEGRRVKSLIDENIPVPKRAELWEDEYGGTKLPLLPPSGCWTLVILSDLKDEGRKIKKGMVRRMIQAALPLGSELNIVLNRTLLNSSKLGQEILKEWVIGHDFVPEELTLTPEAGDDEDGDVELTKVTRGKDTEPFLVLEDVGRVSGRIKLFTEKISGGKSEETAASNGFFVNVLGRVTNNDPAFGEKDLSHSAWARFRMTVRADGLDKLLAVNREQFRQSRALRIFRSFLRKGFNEARSCYDNVVNSAWAETGKVIVEAWGTLPLQPLREVVAQSILGPAPISGLVDTRGIEDRQAAVEDWQRETKEDMRKVIETVSFEPMEPEAGMVQYRLSDRSVIVNSSHPFVQEHFETNEQKRAIRNAALIDLLTDVFAFEMGVDPAQIEDLRKHRDRMARLVAQIDRKSGVLIARILIEMSTYKEFRPFEILVSDALDYLGFTVEKLAIPGEPEGIARAYPTPLSDASSQTYSFTFDAKSSKSGKVKTGNVNVAGLARHREKHSATYALVVAPEFEEGALDEECTQNRITPIRARDVGKLLQLSAEYGAIPLTKLREIFKLTSPQTVAEWVDSLAKWLASNRSLTFDLFFEALRKVEKEIPDVLSASVIALKCREVSGNNKITDTNVQSLARGLQILIPDLIRVEGKDIFISAHPDKIADAVAKQLDRIKNAPVAELTKS
jgi:hypothetical protein